MRTMSQFAPCVSWLSGGGYRIRSKPRRVGILFLQSLKGSTWLALSLFSGSWVSAAAENTTPAASPVALQETNLQQLANATSQIQEQLLTMQRALEQDRLAAKAFAAQNAEALSNGLLALENALTAQQARELETWQNSSQAMERSHRATLIVAGAVAGVGFLALLILTYFQWRTSNKLAEISAAWPMSHGLGSDSPVAALGTGELHAGLGGPAEQASSRLLGALEQLDARLSELKQTISAGGNGERAVNAGEAVTGDAFAGAEAAPSEAVESSHLRTLLNKANSMMNSDNAEAALACCDEALSLAPQNAEALVKKGAILERMHKLNEAIECYDLAIAADNSMTFAYLHKGGLCSRLERFKEALECYEKALRTHEHHTS